MTTSDLRKIVGELIADCVSRLSLLSKAKKEIALGKCPFLSWDKHSLETAGVRPLKIAYNNLQKLQTKLPSLES